MRGLLHVTELILGVNFLLFIAAVFGKGAGFSRGSAIVVDNPNTLSYK
jgi:hypothetical protein